MSQTRKYSWLADTITRPALIGLLLAGITMAVYWRVTNYDFVNYDDGVYVTRNGHVLRGLTWENIRWAFITGHGRNWHPLTWLSHMADVQMFGLSPGGPHLVNVIIHAANAFLLFMVWLRMTSVVWPSVGVAALFALHPLHVESVAWIAERKDVLSTFFFLLSLWMYVRHAQSAQSAGQEERKIRSQTSGYYWMALGCFALGLMSKPMLVTLPFVLMLLDYWPLKRMSRLIIKQPSSILRRLLWEKLPFFWLSLIVCVITIRAEHPAHEVASDGFPLFARLGNALVSYLRYMKKTVWPDDLAVFYPHPATWPGWQVGGAGLVLVAISVLATRSARRCPYFLIGWFWFLGMLAPVIGLVPAGDQAMADRYAYMPLTGLFVALVWGVDDLLRHWGPSRTRSVAIALVGVGTIGTCAVKTGEQLSYWKNTETLFRRALTVTKGNYVAHNNLGICLADTGRADEAMRHYRQAIEIKPAFAQAYYNLGRALASQNRFDEAIENYRAALRRNPGYVEVWDNLGNALADQGRLSEAIENYHRALQVDPKFASACYNLGVALAGQGQSNEALKYYQQAVHFDPSLVRAWNNLGIVLAKQGNLDEAIACFRAALHSEPDHPRAQLNLARALVLQGKNGEAVEHYREVLRLNPEDVEAKQQLRALGARPPR